VCYPSGGQIIVKSFGRVGDIRVTVDNDNDGKTDLAFTRPNAVCDFPP
jgi:hypothetical protein